MSPCLNIGQKNLPYQAGWCKCYIGMDSEGREKSNYILNFHTSRFQKSSHQSSETWMQGRNNLSFLMLIKSHKWRQPWGSPIQQQSRCLKKACSGHTAALFHYLSKYFGVSWTLPHHFFGNKDALDQGVMWIPRKSLCP